MRRSFRPIGASLANSCTLSDNEGTLLSLILRLQPVTAYQVSKVYEQSPVSNFNTSKGKIYPLIRRLEERRLLVKQAVPDDRRGTEVLSCTASGRSAVKDWVMAVQDAHLLLDDPLRTKVQSFELLDRDERISWVVTAKTRLHEKLAELEAYGDAVEVPFKDFVHDNAVSSLRARLDWLDRVLIGVVGSPRR